MNQILGGLTAILISLLIWGVNRKPKRLALGDRYQILNTLNDQISSVEIDKQKSTQVFSTDSGIAVNNLEIPKNIQQKINLIKKITTLSQGNPNARLEAIKISNAWGDRAILPILKKGLKDSDPRVVIEAASAMNKFRGLPHIQNNQTSEQGRPPRNISLMR